MKLSDLLTGGKPSLSFEVFPPKTEETFENVFRAVTEIAELKPDYMSVTYGAGGGTSAYTVKIAAELGKRGIPSLAHLTCVSSTKEGIRSTLTQLRDNGIENILALRGDIPKDFDASRQEYFHASELVREIKSFGGFSVGGACYPEGHPESPNSREDIRYLKEKCDAGCDFLTTQMFFDNGIFYNFMWRAVREGIRVPIIPGIMPVTDARQIRRICAISGNALPQKFLRIVDRYGDNPLAMKQAGIAFATEQIIDLFANGVNAVHVYSMNHPDVACAIQHNLSAILGREDI